MFSIMQLLKWKQANAPPWSHSALIDVQQIHVRNIFLFCFGLSLTRQFFGSNIICQLDGNRVSQELLDTKCFINSTFTNFSGTENPIMPVLYHDYYQWVSVVLLLLAMSFHFPYRVWVKHVSFFLKEISTDLKTVQDCTRVMQVITESRGDYLFWKTFGLECVYFIQLIVQILLINYFFNRVWLLSGWSWHAISMLFPEMASCFYDYYSGGGITTGRFRCLLPLNSVYRRVFWVVYGTFCALLVLHALFFVYRLGLAIRWGKEWINIWWCTQIAKCRAHTWRTKQDLETEFCNLRRKTKLSEEYVCMDDWVIPKNEYYEHKH